MGKCSQYTIKWKEKVIKLYDLWFQMRKDLQMYTKAF